MDKIDRPLSPHLQIYRLPLTAVLSITHRISGIILSLGLLLFVVCLMAVAGGPARYALVEGFFDSLIGRIALWAWIFAFFLHFCHGIRHLIWDTGNGLEKADMTRYAVLELVSAGIFTAALLIYATIFA